jgi:hypothetical protein
MGNIIGVLAHLPQAGEETSGTALGAPRVAGTSIMIMVFLGTALRRHHGGDFWTCVLKRELECIHDDPFL